MHIYSFIQDLHALAKATADKDEKLLLTSRGEIKQNTIFERAIGFGKGLLAKIQGSSYEMREMNLLDAKNEVTQRLKAQFNSFHSKNSELSTSEKTLLNSTVEDFISLNIKSPNFLESPAKTFIDLANRQNLAVSSSGQNLVSTAFENLKVAYRDHENSNKFKIKSRLLDEASNNGKILSKASLEKIDAVAYEAAELMEETGASMGDAITLSKLIKSSALEKITTNDVRYEIAKTFADRYLKTDGSKPDWKFINEKLVDIGEEVTITRRVKYWQGEFNRNGGVHKENREAFSILCSTWEMQAEKNNQDSTQSGLSNHVSNFFILNGTKANLFLQNFKNGNYSTESAKEIYDLINESKRSNLV